MVKTIDATDFITRSCNLFLSHPDRTRFTVKYRSYDKQYTFKVTDDYTNVILKLNRTDNIKQIQNIHNILLQLCVEKEIDDNTVQRIIANVHATEQQHQTSHTSSTATSKQDKSQQRKKKK